MAKYKCKIKNDRLIVKAKFSYGENIDEEELRNFAGKNMNGFLKARIVRNRLIEYTGPTGICLFERLKKPISRHDFFFIIEQIIIVAQTVQKNALHLSKIVLDIHNVFINETTKEIYFIYLPVENQQSSEEIIHFMEKIVYSVVPEKGENTDCFSRFLYFLKGMQEIDMEAIEKYIVKEENSVIEIIKGNAELSVDDEETEIFIDDEETSLFDDEETVLLDEGESMNFPKLYRISTNEKICIKKAVFRIGKDKNCVDYAVTNNVLVSRKHADIISREQRYFIIDLKSKNKTRVNGQVIAEQCEVEIFDKDKIILANEEFEFEC